MITSALLLTLAQVGPNPAPMELEPLPIPRKNQSVVAVPEAPAPDQATAARTGAIAGNQAIIAGEYESAIHLLGEARSAAIMAEDGQMAAEIGLDRARALMMLGRDEEAESELAVVREALPGNAHAWVVSSVNARRLDNFEKAAALVAEALAFAPIDPGVRLEAGTLAYMAGDDASAINHWQDVIANTPASSEARIAEQYLASLDEGPASGEGAGQGPTE